MHGRRAPGVAGMDVLLVDDEALVREMLAEDLADAGLEVTDAPDAEAALGAASAAAGEAGGPPRILVTDVNLGRGMDGLGAEALARGGRRGHDGQTGEPDRAPPRPARGLPAQTLRTAPADRGRARTAGSVPSLRRKRQKRRF